MKKFFEIREHSQGIYGLCSTADHQVFTSSGDGFVVSWNLEKGVQNAFAVKTSATAYSVTCSEKLLFIGLSTGDLHWIDLNTKKEIRFFKQHKAAIFELNYNPVSQLLVSTDADGFVGIWNVEKLILEMYFQLPIGKIRATAWNPAFNQLVIGGQNGEIYQFETQYFNQVHQFYAHNEGVSSLCFNPEGNLLLSGGKDAYIRVWDLNQHKKIKAFPAHLGTIYGIEFSPDNQRFATCSRDKSIKIWDAKSYEIIQKLDLKSGGHQHSVNSILWNDLGLISVSDDRKIIVWK